jgi:copper(I)-binding protein
VYLKLRAQAPDTLLGASTPVAEQAEMHTSTQVDGMMQMRPLERLDLAAGESAEFEPGGRHLMLTGLRQPLATGAQFPLTLRFAKAGELVVQVKVIAPGAAPDR